MGDGMQPAEGNKLFSASTTVVVSAYSADARHSLYPLGSKI